MFRQSSIFYLIQNEIKPSKIEEIVKTIPNSISNNKNNKP